MIGDTDHEFGGVEFFDKDNVKILEAGRMVGESKEFVLNEGERLIGIKSKLISPKPRMEDL